MAKHSRDFRARRESGARRVPARQNARRLKPSSSISPMKFAYNTADLDDAFPRTCSPPKTSPAKLPRYDRKIYLTIETHSPAPRRAKSLTRRYGS